MAPDPDGPRRIQFAGRWWWVKQATDPVGPGPNRFDDSPDAVDVADDGSLVLRIRRIDGRWWCAEVVGEDPTGFGTYEWTVLGDLRDLERNAVCGMFTWSDDTAHANRELDIEVSAWGRSTGVVGHFVVQPAGADRCHAFDVPGSAPWQCSIDWQRDSATFRATAARPWSCDDGVPPSGEVHPRINLWLFRGNEPPADTPIEVRIADFRWTPRP